MGMGKTRNIINILLIAALTSSIMTIGSVRAQIPQPSVPEFTVEIINNSYDVPATNSIDGYTGETIRTPGYHVNDQTITVAIKNQPFNPADDDATYHLCYNIRVKGHFEKDNWRELYSFSAYDLNLPTQAKTGTEETLITFKGDYPDNAQIDIQVEAVGVHNTLVTRYEHLYDFTGTLVPGYEIKQTSDWSNTQTITIGNSESTTTPSASVTLTVLCISVGVLVVVIVLYRKRASKKMPKETAS
jgi:hypothetical protein